MIHDEDDDDWNLKLSSHSFVTFLLFLFCVSGGSRVSNDLDNPYHGSAILHFSTSGPGVVDVEGGFPLSSFTEGPSLTVYRPYQYLYPEMG